MTKQATEEDHVDGVQPDQVATPRDRTEVSELVRESASNASSIVPRGAGTKMSWGVPPRSVDVLVDLSNLNNIVEHNPGDLVVRVESGTRLSDLQESLAKAHQRLSLDEVIPGSTIGGLIATGLSGPLRHLYGSVRDLLIGITIVREDGESVKSGGNVVKNVAGYDLGKLYTGSYGTLGIVTEAVFRLHPLPAASAWVVAKCSSSRQLGECLRVITSSQLAPVSVEIQQVNPTSPLELAVLFEGLPESVAIRGTLMSDDLPHEAEVVSARPDWWGELPGETTIKMTVPLAESAALLGAIRQSFADEIDPPVVRGSAGIGVLYAGFSAVLPPEHIAAATMQLRAICSSLGGAAIVLRAPRSVKEIVDVWGPVPALSLMRAVKEIFDPDGRLSPGRFVGGI